jgi:tetratricopeptide (TPR) repeat protein
MVGSIRPYVLGLTCILVPAAAAPGRAFGDPQAAEKEAKAKDDGAKPDNAAVSKEERVKLLALPGEDPPQPFVPARPRTVEDRKRIEALTAYSAARALEGKRSWSEAIALLEGALKLDPDSVTVLRRLSRLCFVLGRTEPGIKYCKRVLELDPGDTDTITRLVGYYTRRSDPAGAEAVLQEVLANPRLDKSAPGRLIAEFELGKLYAGKLRQVDKAADAYAHVIEALDEKAANKLSQADQRRVLGGEEAAAYQEFGLTFLQAKRYDLAIKAFERGLNYEPDDPQLPLLLARTFLKVNRGEEALAQVERFLKRQPQGVEGYDLLAEILTALKRPGEILPRLEEAARVDSKNVGLKYTLADRYREAGQVERAEAMYKALLAEQPTTQGYGALAASLLKRKKAEELLKVIAEAITRPGGFEAVQEPIKGIIDDPELADQVLGAGLKLLSAEPPGLDRPGILVLARIANLAGKLEKFLPIQRLALKRNPSPQTYKEAIAVLLSLRKLDDLTATFEEMLAKYPEERNARQLAELARIYKLADKTDDAVRTAREAVKLDPNDAGVKLQAALVLSQAGKADEAIKMLRAAAQKEPGNPEPSIFLGSVLAQTGHNDEAMTLFKGLLEKFPNNDEVIRSARSNLSIIYVNLGDYAKGEAELEILLERNPDEAGVNNDLGYLYAEQGKNLEKAEVMIRKAVQEDPDNSAYLDSLGWVLFKRGKVKEAVEPLEKAVKQLADSATGGDATIYEHLGDVYFQLQDSARAKSAWQSAEKSATKTNPPDKRLPEIRKKLESLEKLGQVPKPSAGATP